METNLDLQTTDERPWSWSFPSVDLHNLNDQWKAFSRFLETFDTLPLILVVSAVHYTGVLLEHEPWVVAVLQAIVLDTAHFSTVKRARGASGWGLLGWLVALLFISVLAFSLQYSFYLPEGTELLTWDLSAFRNALVIPSLVVLSAFLHGEKSEGSAAVIDGVLADALEQLRPEVARRLQVAQLIAEGFTIDELAERFDVDKRTIKRDLEKLGVSHV